MIREMNTCAGRHVFELRAGPFFVSETVHIGGQALARHEHQVAILHCVLSGFYYESVGSSPLQLGPGEFLFKPPEMCHRNRFDADGARTLRIEFSPSDCQSIGARTPRGRRGRVSLLSIVSFGSRCPGSGLPGETRW